jgi:hypothetical protein
MLVKEAARDIEANKVPGEFNAVSSDVIKTGWKAKVGSTT